LTNELLLALFDMLPVGFKVHDVNCITINLFSKSTDYFCSKNKFCGQNLHFQTIKMATFKNLPHPPMFASCTG
jgi:hypothetical protein